MSAAAAAPPAEGLRLAPADIAAAAEPAPWGWACGPRLFWLLGGGVVLWLAMLVQPRWIIGLLAWEAGALLAWVVDARRLAAPASLQVRRQWPDAAHLGGARLRWSVRNVGGRSLR
ncbi:MAG: hypothetical protein ACRD13_03650, partial [Terriglobales bacterium]